MKFCYYEYKNEKSWGLFKDNLIFPVPETQIFSQSENNIRLKNSIDSSDVRFFPPVNPSKIVCVGRNYAEHAAELGNQVPQEPLLFLKATSSIITDGETIIIPAQSDQVEHEGELGVIIGRACKNLSQDENYSDYIFGYICLNDVTARDLQRRDVQFTRAKSFDTFCPVGALIETELDIDDVRVTTKVNNVIKQDGRTSQMVFPVSFLIPYISQQMTLNAGDIIATGTPSGVSKLASGDVCEVEIEGIGILRNTVI
jgi:2-keto-4-pentenoate hydratase/2-oxohepta-3-ene-1,7-dioic acid hydratase in catechol pathway